MASSLMRLWRSGAAHARASGSAASPASVSSRLLRPAPLPRRHQQTLHTERSVGTAATSAGGSDREAEHPAAGGTASERSFLVGRAGFLRVLHALIVSYCILGRPKQCWGRRGRAGATSAASDGRACCAGRMHTSRYPCRYWPDLHAHLNTQPLMIFPRLPAKQEHLFPLPLPAGRGAQPQQQHGGAHARSHRVRAHAQGAHGTGGAW